MGSLSKSGLALAPSWAWPIRATPGSDASPRVRYAPRAEASPDGRTVSARRVDRGRCRDGRARTAVARVGAAGAVGADGG